MSAWPGPGHLVSMADVNPEPVSWLWPGRIPAGKFTLLDGDPGLGKSTLTLDLAAHLTRGDTMPDGSRPYCRGAQQVLLLTAEDGLADTVRPRLDAADAVPELVSVLRSVPTEDGRGRPPTIDDLDCIEEALRETNARLFVIDPLMAFLPDGVNSYRDKEIRRLLAPLAGLADRTGAAILAIRHLTKSNGGNPLYRGGGSIGIIGAARSGLLVAPDPDDETEGRRILASTKSNLAPKPPALAYRLEGTDGAVGARWEGETEHTAGQLLERSSSNERTARHEAADFLRKKLRDGPVPSEDLRSLAERRGISWRTLRRAKEAIGAVSSREGGVGADGYWSWHLPDNSAKGSGRDKADRGVAEIENGPKTREDRRDTDLYPGHAENVAGLEPEDAPETELFR